MLSSLLDRAALDFGTSSGLVIRSHLGHLCTKLIMYPGTFKLGSVSKDHNIMLRITKSSFMLLG